MVALKNQHFLEELPRDGTQSALGRILRENTNIMYYGSYKKFQGDGMVYVFHCPSSGAKKLQDRIQEFLVQYNLIHDAQSKVLEWPDKDLDLISRHPFAKSGSR